MSSELKKEVLQLAEQAGFDLYGIAPVQLPAEDQQNYRTFIEEGRHGSMAYLARHLALRLDARQVFAEARSALVLGVYYRDQQSESALKGAQVRIARYAHGRDYHRYLRKRGKRLLEAIQAIHPATSGRIVVDSAPVAEKSLARLAGLGWRGKHTNLIHPELGSYFFLAVLLLNLELPVDAPLMDQCGECRLCLDACPTDALSEYRIDARLCISYQTIERKADTEASPLVPERAGWIFGCDICQEVCPYNRNRRVRGLGTEDSGFHLRPAVAELMQAGQLPAEPMLSELLRGSALGRAGAQMLQENIKQSGGPTKTRSNSGDV